MLIRAVSNIFCTYFARVAVAIEPPNGTQMSQNLVKEHQVAHLIPTRLFNKLSDALCPTFVENMSIRFQGYGYFPIDVRG